MIERQQTSIEGYKDISPEIFLDKLRAINALHQGKSVGELPPYEFSKVRVTFNVDRGVLRPELGAGPDNEALKENILETGVVEGDAYMLEQGTFAYSSDSVMAEEGATEQETESLRIGTRPFPRQQHFLGGEMLEVRGRIPTELITKIEVILEPVEKKGW